MVFQKRELDKQWLQLEVLINISYIQIEIVRRNKHTIYVFIITKVMN